MNTTSPPRALAARRPHVPAPGDPRRRRPARALSLGLAALLAGAIALSPLVLPSAALASPTQQSLFQDDNLLIYNTPQGVAQTLDTLQQLGVDRIRVSVFWATVAPDPTSRTRPNFDATNPAAYPAGAWDRYDQVIEMAQARGIAVDLDITSPAPLWATAPKPSQSSIAAEWEPSSSEFGQFVQAVATRYSGTYSPPSAAPAPPPPCNAIVALLGGCAKPMAAAPASAPLPRVSFWSVWNEPNQPGWLDPQWLSQSESHPTAYAETSPTIYRGLLDAAWSALGATGHGGDTILIGELAPKGVNARGPARAIAALLFLRQLYCLGNNYQPLRGTAATARQCPTTAAATAAFPAANPALFKATGWAQHPYELTTAPNTPPSSPNDATIANLPALTAALRRAFAAYHQPGVAGGAGGLPLYLTEFGYITNPPNPAGVTLAQQSLFLNESEYIAFRDPQVQMMDQFLLQDAPPHTAGSGTTPGYVGTFQTGLEFLGGKAKPSLAAYELPIYLPRPVVPAGRKVLVWGLVRPAAHAGDTTARVAVEYAPTPSRHFQTLTTVTANLGRGFLETNVTVPRSGVLRLQWTDPTGGAVVTSRSATVVITHGKKKKAHPAPAKRK